VSPDTPHWRMTRSKESPFASNASAQASKHSSVARSSSTRSAKIPHWPQASFALFGRRWCLRQILRLTTTSRRARQGPLAVSKPSPATETSGRESVLPCNSASQNFLVVTSPRRSRLSFACVGRSRSFLATHIDEPRDLDKTGEECPNA